MNVCPRCNNRDPAYFYKGSKGIYCRKCIRFKRILIEEEATVPSFEVHEGVGHLTMEYPLTDAQKEASRKCLNAIQKKDVLLHCVCGAGKTEIVTESIQYYLKRQKKVCYAIARKEVVIELSKRFASFFKDAKVVAVYGGHHDEIYGDLIVCTTHQLYRYPRCFDLLILDEVDAFPFKGDEVLMAIAKNVVVGHTIYSTATIDAYLEELLKRNEVELVSLTKRPHGKPLIVPEVMYGPKFILFVKLFQLLRKTKRQTIVFVPSKKSAMYLYYFFRLFFPSTYVYSDLESRNENIMAFKRKKYRFIFATTVLERGITIEGVDVIVYDVIRGIFDKASLIQMTGRVGRSFKDPYGQAYILSSHFSKEIRACIEEIKGANEDALLLLR